MKHSFSRTVKFVPTWNGNDKLPEEQQIVAEIKALRVSDMLILMDALGGIKDGSMNVADIGRIVKETGHLLPEYVSISNLEDDSGPVPINDLVTYPTYLELAVELLMKCANISMPSQVAEGNSARPPV